MRYWGKYIVWAIHPKMPSDGYYANGKKRHLAKNTSWTYCNMRVDGLFEKNQVNNGMCKNCMKALKRDRNEK